jgi:hypothetical protein
MRVRRTFLGLGLFLFGVGITFAGAEASNASNPTVTFLGAMVCLLIAAILFGWSVTD